MCVYHSNCAYCVSINFITKIVTKKTAGITKSSFSDILYDKASLVISLLDPVIKLTSVKKDTVYL